MSSQRVDVAEPSGTVWAEVTDGELTGLQIRKAALRHDNVEELSPHLVGCISEAFRQYRTLSVEQLTHDDPDADLWSEIDAFLGPRTAELDELPEAGDVITATAAAGDVEVSITDGTLTGMDIYPALLRPEERFSLENAIKAAVNDAMQRYVDAPSLPRDRPPLDRADLLDVVARIREHQQRRGLR